MGLGVGVMVVLPMTISGTPTDGKVAFNVNEAEVDAFENISICHAADARKVWGVTHRYRYRQTLLRV